MSLKLVEILTDKGFASLDFPIAEASSEPKNRDSGETHCCNNPKPTKPSEVLLLQSIKTQESCE